MTRPRRLRRGLRSDEGFGLIEAVVSLAIASTVLLALLTSSVFALRSTVDARKNQQAADYLTEAIEGGRSIDYGGMTMKTTDLPTAPGVVENVGVPEYDPGTGAEPVSHSAGGAISPAVQTLATANGEYLLRRWVTVPVGTALDGTGVPVVRRLTAEIEWTSQGRTHTRQASTLVTRTRRGLALPNFTFGYNGPAPITAGEPHWTKNPGADVEFGLVVSNLGARDSWTFASTTSGWSYYLDADRDGLWSEDLVTEPLLTTPRTGLIEPGTDAVYVVARRVTLATDPAGTTSAVFTATSEAQPDVSKAVPTKYTLQAGVVVPPTSNPTTTPTTAPTTAPVACTPGSATGVTGSNAAPAVTTSGGHTLTSLYAFNGTATGDSTTHASSSLGKDAGGLQATPCNFSTDQQTDQAGRLLTSSGAAPLGVATWQFQPASAAEDSVRGTAVMVLYVQCHVSTSPQLTVRLSSLVGTTSSTLVTRTVTPTGCAGSGFSRLDVPLVIPGNGATVGTAGRLVVNITSTSPVRLLYGTTSAPSRLVVGVK